MAGQSQVVGVVATAVLSRNDVLNMMFERTVLLLQEAVLAAVYCAAADQLPRGGIHRYLAIDSSCRMAFTLRIPTRSAALTKASYSARSSSVSRPSFARAARYSTRAMTTSFT